MTEERDNYEGYSNDVHEYLQVGEYLLESIEDDENISQQVTLLAGVAFQVGSAIARALLAVACAIRESE